MATYFTGSESPAASGGGGSSNNYLRNLSQLAESEGRSRYYDHLASQAEQRLGMQEDNDQKAAFLQQELNEHGTPQHATYRQNIGELRGQLGNSMQMLDEAIGFGNSQNNRAGTTRKMLPEDRLKRYEKVLENWNPTTADGEPGITGSKDQLIDHWYNASKVYPLLESYEDAIEKIPGNQSFINEKGTEDYRYIPRDDAIRYYRTKYGKDFETGSPLERAQQPAEEQPTALRAAALAREPQRAGMSSPEYITPIRPGGALVPQAPQAVATAGPENVPAPRPAPLGPINYIAPDENDYPELAPQSLPSPDPRQQQLPQGASPLGVMDNSGNVQFYQTNPDDMFSQEALEENKRQSDNSYYMRKLDEANATIASLEAAPEPKAGLPKIDGELHRKQLLDPRALDIPGNFNLRLYNKALEDRDMYEGLIEFTAPQHTPSEPFVFPDGYVPAQAPQYLSTDEPPATGLRRYPPLQREVPLRLDQLQPLRN
jgi:hypothetical protein